MSRIGKKLIKIPQGVTVTLDSGRIAVKGPKGTLERSFHKDVSVSEKDSALHVTIPADKPELGNFQGLTRSLIANMIEGVDKSFSKTLKLVGVGYRAKLAGKDLDLTLGFSHPVIYKVPEGIEIKVEKQTTIVVSGVDKEQVGQTAADIRAYRKPEPYHGKGVRYSDEHIALKAGKAGAKK